MKIFFSGIGGSGVSALASFMADKGHIVFGSDRTFDKDPDQPLYKLLQSKGIHLASQDGNGIDSSFDLCIFSTAVEHDHPEILKAKSLRIPIKTRPEYLAEIVLDFKTIAVAGTSGKSTTSGMLAFLMQRLGLKPNFIGGGRVKQFKTEKNLGNSLTGDSDILIIEACESDGTIVNYKPIHSVILNLDLDHHSVDKTATMFETLIKNTAGKIIINVDDNNVRKYKLETSGQGSGEKTITFSIERQSHYKAENIFYKPFSTTFLLHGIEFELSIPGKYNLYNAIACIAILAEIGIPIKDIANILHEFKGIERRFDIHLNNNKHLVIDDYAHNPHKIASLMQTVSNIKEKICYIFQPHGFAPTKLMKNEYIKSFTENLRQSDHLILLPIFYAGGTVNKDISSNDLAKEIMANGKSAEVIYNRDEILKKLNKWDNYIIFGARDETLSNLARQIANSLRPDLSDFKAFN